MADTKIDASGIAYLLNRRLKGVTDQIAKACPLFKWLKEKGCLQMGQGWNDGVEFYIHTTNSLEDAVRVAGDYNNASAMIVNDRKKVSVQGCVIHLGIGNSAYRNERLANMPERDQNFDLLLEEMNQAKQALTQRLCRFLYGDGTLYDPRDTTVPFPGVEAMTAQTNTYATLDRTDTANAFWKAQYQTQTLASFTTKGTYFADTYDGVANMRKIAQAIQQQGAVNGKDTPNGLPLIGEDFDAVFTDLPTFQAYESTFDANTRFESIEDKDWGNGKALPFNRKPVIVDPFCTTKRMYFLQAKAIEALCVKKGELFQVIAEDKTNVVQALVLNTQFAMLTRKPRALGQFKLT